MNSYNGKHLPNGIFEEIKKTINSKQKRGSYYYRVYTLRFPRNCRSAAARLRFLLLAFLLYVEVSSLWILPIKRAKVAWESRAIAAADFLFPEKNNEYEKLYKCPFLLRRNTFLGDTRYFWWKNTSSKYKKGISRIFRTRYFFPGRRNQLTQ